MTKFYLYGNTSVRTPMRFQRGLTVVQDAGFNGNLSTKKMEEKFKIALDQEGVIREQKDAKDTSSVARKWRSAFSKTGFLTPLDQTLIDEVTKKYPTLGLQNKAQITPQGDRLINAETTADIQDAMLRALLAIQIRLDGDSNSYFKPFPFAMSVMNNLKEKGADEAVNRVELVYIGSVMDSSESNRVAEDIIDFREKRKQCVGKRAKNKCDRDFLTPIAEEYGIQYDTLKTYGDPNFKYMLATGLFSRKGRRIGFNENKRVTIDQILKNEPKIYENQEDYYYNLWNGYPLPDDDKNVVIEEIKVLSQKLGVSVPKNMNKESVPDLKQCMHSLQDRDNQNLENKFAADQVNQVNDIICYLRVINGETKGSDDNFKNAFENANDDLPTYFEWTTWRAFLAIDGLENAPGNARGFRVDQDLYPSGTAPGGRPDNMFEFKDYILVVEVTLTTSSRQEAAEAEPVRRHVAQIQEEHPDKPVYGLFIAKEIDNNTAEMFRLGMWYSKDDPFFINIVPITINQFISIMEKFEKYKFTNDQIERLIEKCLIPRNATVTLWKNEIGRVIDNYQFSHNA